TGGRDAGDPIGQRPDLPEPTISGGVPGLPALGQEFITPYTPQQNGIVERFFRSLKEECVWQHNFNSFVDARVAVARWIDWYNESRPHQSLGYLSPRRYREQKLALMVQGSVQ